MKRSADIIAGAVALAGVWVLAARLLPTGLPPGIVVNGLISGSLLAVSACAVVLVYRVDRVVNFTQAAIGSVAGVCAVGLTTHYGWPWVLSFPAGLLAGGLVGAGVSVGVIDRMRTRPRLAATVATIGLSEVLAGGAALLGGALTTRPGTATFQAPVHRTFGIRPVVFHADAVLALGGSVVLLAGLAAALARTRAGLAFRAVSEDPERAALAGMPRWAVSVGVWTVGGAAAAVAAMLKAPLAGAPVAFSLAGNSSAVLLRVLAAAAIGGMRDLRRTALAAVTIGVLDEAAVWAYSRTIYVDVLLVVIVLVALVLNRDRFSRKAVSAGAELAVREAARRTRPVIAVAVLGAAALWPLVARPSQDHAGAVVCVYAIVAVSLLVLTGWAGYVSLGQFALAGLGGAVTSVLVGRHGWDLTLALGAGIVVASVVSVVIGLPTLRVRGPIAAVTTLAFAVAASSYLLVHRFVPWLIDDNITRPVLWGRIDLSGEGATYELCLAGVVMSLIAVRNLRASRTGRAMLAVRDNEPAAAAAGIATTRVKLTAFAVSGALAGLAGGLYVILQQGLQVDSYAPEASLRLFAMVILGGLSSVTGVVLGAVVIRGTEVLFPSGWALLASGFGITAMVALFPAGLGGLVARARDVVMRT